MAPAKTTPLPYKPRVGREQRRLLIREAAARLFAERGYDGVSLDEIAAAADITKAVIYDHFSSKRELHVSLLEEQSRELLRRTRASIKGKATPELQFRASVEAFFAFVEEHPYAWRMFFRDPPADPEIAAVASRLHGNATRSIAEMLVSHPAVQAAGFGASDAGAVLSAEYLRAGMDGAAAWWYEQRDVPREQMVHAVVALAWPGLEHMARLSAAAPKRSASAGPRRRRARTR